MSILLIDGVRYEKWRPTNEDEFERMVKEHAEDIFGEQSIYLDIKHKLKSKSGIGSIPDGYVIVFGDQTQWHIVEVELSTHPLYEHIVPQISKFINGIRNPSTQKDVVDALYREIDSDEFRRLQLKKAIGTTETYKFLSDLTSKPPVVTIIIEKRTEQLDDAISALAHSQIKVVEFQTFTREGIGLGVHAHLFAPLFKPPSEMPITEEAPKILPESVIVITVKPAYIKYKYLPILQKYRSLFPGFKTPFGLDTDIGMIETAVYALYPAKWREGDMNSDAGFYRGLRTWFKAHHELTAGQKLIIEVIEPMKRYRLKIV
jgi:hypothetical protein